MSDRYEQESMEFKPNEDGSVHVIFARFGKGGERTSDFVAVFDWEDVEALAKALQANGNPAATRFEHAMNLAAAIEFFAK